METGIIIQARCGSSRLPDKMILPFYGEECILSVLLGRLTQRIPKRQIIVATTTNPKDNLITTICTQHGIAYFRGSETDVLQRFTEAAGFYQFNKIIRICADNPFLSLDDIQFLLQTMTGSSDDYMAFATSKNVPTIKTHYGFWGEAVTLETLKRINTLTQESVYHEHVTNYIYANPALFKIRYFPISLEIESEPVRLTVDTEEDFKLQQKIFSEAIRKGMELTPANIIGIIKKHPDYYQTMAEQIKKNSK